MNKLLAALCVVACASPAQAQWLKYDVPGLPRTSDGTVDLGAPAPRTTDGRPDMSGLWRVGGGGRFLENVFADTRPEDIPMQPWAAAVYEKRLTKDDPTTRCMPLGVPRSYKSTFRMLQTPAVVGILNETLTVYRQIFTDGRALPVNPNPTWLGYSVGRWDGDVLVVDSAGFNDKTWLDSMGHPHTEALHVSERFSRPDVGHLHVQVTLEDPQAYTRPWTVGYEFRLVTNTEMLETICENTADIAPRLIGVEPTHPPTPKTMPMVAEQLARYAGTYALQPGVNVRLEAAGDHLTIQFPRNPDVVPIFAVTPAQFVETSGDGLVDFQSDAAGRITGFVLRSGLSDRVYDHATRLGNEPGTP